MAQDYLIGARLDEYHLEMLLGRGGMARVYRAVDVNLNRFTAIKVIDIPLRAEPEYVHRFKREAQALARLDHPHIIRLYRYGEASPDTGGDSLLYMAMQYIEGANLKVVLDSYRRDGEFMEAVEVGRIIREVGEALDTAHSQGIIHRDVKPANILLDTRGRTILTDFGLTMLSTQATRGEVFGSPQYIAPEQAVSSAKAVPQTDLYSLGVVLYEMLTGAPPFVAAEPLELALMHVNQPAPPPRSHRPEIPEALEAVVLRALAKRPEDRYPTGKALAGALDAVLVDLPQPELPPQGTIPQRVTLALHPPDRSISLPPATNGVFPRTVQRPGVEPPLSAGGDRTAGGGVSSGGGSPSGEGGTPRRPVLPTISAWKQSGEAGEAQPADMSPAGIPAGHSIAANSNAAAGSNTAAGGSTPAAGAASSGLPGRARPKGRRLWIAGLLGSVLLLVLCLGGSGAFLYDRLLAAPQKTRAAGETARTPAPTEHEGNPTAAAEETFAALLHPSPTAPGNPSATSPATGLETVTYQFQVSRRGEDKAYFVLRNSGDVDLPLEPLVFRAEKSQLESVTWGVDQLPPGGCLLARKEDRKDNSLPEGLPCIPAGDTASIKKNQDGIFKEKIIVFFGNREVGVCERDQQVCYFSFKN